jgi:hypothetical protein
MPNHGCDCRRTSQTLGWTILAAPGRGLRHPWAKPIAQVPDLPPRWVSSCLRLQRGPFTQASEEAACAASVASTAIREGLATLYVPCKSI